MKKDESHENRSKAVKAFLSRRFLEWEASLGQRMTIKEFAEYLGVQRPSLTLWMSGDRTPTGEWVHTLAAKLGPELYDVLGLQRPDPQLMFVTARWHTLPDVAKERIRKIVEEGGGGEARARVALRKVG